MRVGAYIRTDVLECGHKEAPAVCHHPGVRLDLTRRSSVADSTTPLPPEKPCSKCGRILPAAMFRRRANRPSGLRSACRDCDRKRERRYRDATRHERLAYGEQYRAARREYLLDLNKRYREANPELCRQRTREWAARNASAVAEKRRRYNEANREAVRESHKRWRRANPEKWRECVARYEARKRATQVGPVDYKAILARDGLVCHICGQAVEPADVEFDHVIPVSKGGPHSAENIRVSHAACNNWKRARILP